MKIGAVPALGSGLVSRKESQEWARAIYEDLPVCGVRYRTSHDEGFALAIWDNSPDLRVVESLADGVQDFQLVRAPPVLRRFRQAMGIRGIAVKIVDAANCRQCGREAGGP